MSCKTKKEFFFLENPWELVDGNNMNLSFFPQDFSSDGESYESKMNALTRLIILAFVVLLVFNVDYSCLFLLMAIILITVVYYIGRRKDCNSSDDNEYYHEIQNTINKNNKNKNISPVNNYINTEDNMSCQARKIIDANQQLKFPIGTIYAQDLKNSDQATLNRDKWRMKNDPINNNDMTGDDDPGCIVKLDHGTNQRQFIPPIIPTPAYDTEVWANQSSLPGNHANGDYLQPFMFTDGGYGFKSQEIKGMEPAANNRGCIPEYAWDGNQRFFMQTLQPNVYTYWKDEIPINSSLGINGAYERPPLFKDQVCNRPDVTVFSRIDPQLIRDDVPAGRKAEMPTRDQFSAKYSHWEAGRGTKDPEDINEIDKNIAILLDKKRSIEASGTPFSIQGRDVDYFSHTERKFDPESLNKVDQELNAWYKKRQTWVRTGDFTGPPVIPQNQGGQYNDSSVNNLKERTKIPLPNIYESKIRLPNPATQTPLPGMNEHYSETDADFSEHYSDPTPLPQNSQSQTRIPLPKKKDERKSKEQYSNLQQFEGHKISNNDSTPLYTEHKPQFNQRQSELINQLNDRSTYVSAHELQALRGDIPAPIGPADISDRKLKSYGDPMRSYYDIDSGNINYYYGDTDAYKGVNYTNRTKVDTIDIEDPMGVVKPYYIKSGSCKNEDWSCQPRKIPNQNLAAELGLDSVREQVEDAWTRDSIFFRESLMATQSERDNARRWQFRYAPLRKNYGAGGKLMQ